MESKDPADVLKRFNSLSEEKRNWILDQIAKDDL
jgi:hypothetical protein